MEVTNADEDRNSMTASDLAGRKRDALDVLRVYVVFKAVVLTVLVGVGLATGDWNWIVPFTIIPATMLFFLALIRWY